MSRLVILCFFFNVRYYWQIDADCLCVVRCGRAWFDVVQWLGRFLFNNMLLKSFKEPMRFHFLEIQDAFSLRWQMQPLLFSLIFPDGA